MNVKKISILGCGWLGLPLGRYLAGEGFTVKGSTTSERKIAALKEAGIEPYKIVIGEALEGDIASFLDSDILVLDIPPGRGEAVVEHHVGQISLLIDALADSPVRYVLFVSSTSVYPSPGREVVETDAEDPEVADSLAGRALLYVEEMLRSESSFSTTVLRFGGLIGPGRNPAEFMQRMTEIANPGQPVNFIHLDDCIGIIAAIIRQGEWGEVFNACAPLHPTRGEIYKAAAESHGLAALPEEPSGSKDFKLVNSDKLVTKLGYTFLRPDPLAMARGSN
ncbi:MAG: SDR family oxidoreductase [Chlorobaculum sp.]|jgi:nucleoside-diphosphate-sugar epimerase|nr:SDR family oxidoreductase [Chlorobaculum sp.]